MLHLQFTVGVVCSRSLLIVVNLFELIRINSGFVGNIASQPFFLIFYLIIIISLLHFLSVFFFRFFPLPSLSLSLSLPFFLTHTFSLSLFLSLNPVSFTSLFPRKFKSRSARLHHKHYHRRHHYYYDTISFFFFRRELNTSAYFFSLRFIFFFSFTYVQTSLYEKGPVDKYIDSPSGYKRLQVHTHDVLSIFQTSFLVQNSLDLSDLPVVSTIIFIFIFFFVFFLYFFFFCSLLSCLRVLSRTRFYSCSTSSYDTTKYLKKKAAIVVLRFLTPF